MEKGSIVRHPVYGHGRVESISLSGKAVRVFFDSAGTSLTLPLSEFERGGSGSMQTVTPGQEKPSAPRGEVSPSSYRPRLVLESLRQGIPAPTDLEAWTVGFREVRDRVGAAIDDVTRGKGSVVVVEGDYGQGKSHVGRLARGIALSRNLATMQTEVDGQAITLASGVTLLPSLLSSLEVPNGRGQGHRIAGLGTLLRVLGPRLGRQLPKGCEPFLPLFKAWEELEADEEAIEAAESYLVGGSAAAAERVLRSHLNRPQLKLSALRIASGTTEERTKNQAEQIARLLQLTKECGARGGFVLIDELDHDFANLKLRAKVNQTLAIWASVLSQHAIVMMLLAPPKCGLDLPSARKVRLPDLKPEELRGVAERAVRAFVAVHPRWPGAANNDVFHTRLQAKYEAEYRRLGWGPRFFVRAAIECCEAAKAAGTTLDEVEL